MTQPTITRHRFVRRVIRDYVDRYRYDGAPWTMHEKAEMYYKARTVMPADLLQALVESPQPYGS